MSNARKLTGRALILASGPTTPDAIDVIDRALRDFVHEKSETQRIDLGGRTIVALEVSIDPAHANAISEELEVIGKRANLDIAMELL